MAEVANYHIELWPVGGGPSTYLCLLCSVVRDATEAEMLVHVATVHAATPVPTPLAANPPPTPTFSQERTSDG